MGGNQSARWCVFGNLNTGDHVTAPTTVYFDFYQSAPLALLILFLPQAKVIMRSVMSNHKLEKTVGGNVCSWCFARDDTVLRHGDTETYWHEGCFEQARDVFRPVVGWLITQKINTDL